MFANVVYISKSLFCRKVNSYSWKSNCKKNSQPLILIFDFDTSLHGNNVKRFRRQNKTLTFEHFLIDVMFEWCSFLCTLHTKMTLKFQMALTICEKRHSQVANYRSIIISVNSKSRLISLHNGKKQWNKTKVLLAIKIWSLKKLTSLVIV